MVTAHATTREDQDDAVAPMAGCRSLAADGSADRLRTDLARADDPGDRAVRCRSRQRHRRTHRARAGIEAGQPADRDREPAGRGRHHRRHRRRQGTAQRLHHPGALLLLQCRLFALQEPALRHAQRLHRGDSARQNTDRAGGVAGQGLQDRRRSDRRRQGQARRHELRFRRHRLGIASRRRALSPQRRDRSAAHPLPRAERGIHRVDGRTHRFLFSAARTGAAAGQARPVDRARGEHRHTGGRPARRADDDGARL